MQVRKAGSSPHLTKSFQAADEDGVHVQSCCPCQFVNWTASARRSESVRLQSWREMVVIPPPVESLERRRDSLRVLREGRGAQEEILRFASNLPALRFVCSANGCSEASARP